MDKTAEYSVRLCSSSSFQDTGLLNPLLDQLQLFLRILVGRVLPVVSVFLLLMIILTLCQLKHLYTYTDVGSTNIARQYMKHCKISIVGACLVCSPIVALQSQYMTYVILL